MNLHQGVVPSHDKNCRYNSIGSVRPIGRRRVEHGGRGPSAVHRNGYGVLQPPSIFLILITYGTNMSHSHVTTTESLSVEVMLYRREGTMKTRDETPLGADMVPSRALCLGS